MENFTNKVKHWVFFELLLTLVSVFYIVDLMTALNSTVNGWSITLVIILILRFLFMIRIVLDSIKFTLPTLSFKNITSYNNIILFSNIICISTTITIWFVDVETFMGAVLILPWILAIGWYYNKPLKKIHAITMLFPLFFMIVSVIWVFGIGLRPYEAREPIGSVFIIGTLLSIYLAANNKKP